MEELSNPVNEYLCEVKREQEDMRSVACVLVTLKTKNRVARMTSKVKILNHIYGYNDDTFMYHEILSE